MAITPTVTHNPRNAQGEIAALVSDKRHEIVKAINMIDHWGDADVIRNGLLCAAADLVALDNKVSDIDSAD